MSDSSHNVVYGEPAFNSLALAIKMYIAGFIDGNAHRDLLSEYESHQEDTLMNVLERAPKSGERLKKLEDVFEGKPIDELRARTERNLVSNLDELGPPTSHANPYECDYQAYLRIEPRLLREHPGEYAAFHRGRCIAIGPNEKQVFEEARAKVGGPGMIMIQPIVPTKDIRPLRVSGAHLFQTPR